MICPCCGTTERSTILDTYVCDDNRRRRRRECSACKFRWTTLEVDEQEYDRLSRMKGRLAELIGAIREGEEPSHEGGQVG